MLPECRDGVAVRQEGTKVTEYGLSLTVMSVLGRIHQGPGAR